MALAVAFLSLSHPIFALVLPPPTSEDLPELTPHLRLHPLWTLTMFMLEPRPHAPHLQKLPWRRCALQPPAESDPLSTLHGYSWAACCNITMFCPAPLAPGAEGRAALGCPLAWHRAGV